MNAFRAGFTDELIKVSAPFGAPTPIQPPGGRPAGVVKPASTATPGSGAPVAPPNAMNAKPGELLNAIPTQKMESPAKTAPQTWRPSPGYRPSTAGDPKPAAPAPKAQGGGARKSDVPWETAPQRLQRIGKEQSYNAGLKQTNAQIPTSTTSASTPGYNVTPQFAAQQAVSGLAGQVADKQKRKQVAAAQRAQDRIEKQQPIIGNKM